MLTYAAGKQHMCYKAIMKLLRGLPEDGGILPLDPSVEPKITLAWIKYLYSTADKRNQAASSQRMLTYADVC